MSAHVDRPTLRECALGAPASTRLEAHLAACEPCRQTLDGERALARRIDAELASAFSLEPSPGFEARVQARLHEARGDAAWLSPFGRLRSSARQWWWLLAAGAAVVMLLAVVRLVPRGAHVPTRSVEVRPTAPATPQSSVVPQPPSPGERASEPRFAASDGQAEHVRDSARSRAPRRKPVRAPRVLVPPGEAVALAQFVAGRARWRLDEATDTLEGLAPLAVAPLVVEPLGSDD